MQLTILILTVINFLFLLGFAVAVIRDNKENR
jgi:hypothetical protein